MRSAWPSILNAAVLTLGIVSCSGPESTEPAKWYETSDRIDGNAPLGSAKVLVVQNTIGHVLFSGNGPDTTLSWHLTRTVSGTDQSQLAGHLNDISISFVYAGDTTFVAATTPGGQSAYSYTCVLSLTAPFNVPCVIAPVTGIVDVSDLDTSLVVSANGDIMLARVSGSTSIVSAAGNITVETALGAGDSCFCSTGKGDIALHIPTSTSAVVNASTGQGDLSYTNLVFDSLQQTALSLSGILGTGNGRIHLSTTAGNITMTGF